LTRLDERKEYSGLVVMNMVTLQAVVHLGHLQLVVEVADGAQALDDDLDPTLLAEVDDEPVEAVDMDVAVAGGDVTEHLRALLEREKPALARVDTDGDHDLVVQETCPADDVQVTEGHGIEGPRADSPSHDRRPYQSVASP